MAEEKAGHIVNVMKEERLFHPSEEFSSKARIGSMEEYEKLWQKAADDLEAVFGRGRCNFNEDRQLRFG